MTSFPSGAAEGATQSAPGSARPSKPAGMRVLYLAALAMVVEGCLVAWVVTGNLRQRPFLFLGSYLLSFVAYGLAWWCGRHHFGRTSTFLWVFGLAVLFRLTLLPAQPGLSDDLYRYLWDGKTQIAGINPYAYAPADPELRFLRDEHWERINHKEIPSIYPPVMQMLFASAYVATQSPLGFKLLLVLCDLGILGLLWRLASRLRVEPWNVAIYAWNPLVLLEVGASGHNDVVPLLFLLAALLLIIRARHFLSTILFATAVLAKIFPVLVLPTFVRRTRTTRLWLLPVVLAAGFLPYLGAGRHVTEGLAAYARRWQHNDLVFRWVLGVTQWMEPSEALKRAITWIRGLFGGTEVLSFLYFYTHPQYVARGIVGLLMIIVVVYLSFRPWRPTREVLVALAAVLFLSPTVHPWYLIWFAPLLVLHPSRGLLLWTALAPLSYFLAAADPAGEPPGGWLLYLEYLPVLAVLGLETLRARRVGPPEPGRFP